MFGNRCGRREFLKATGAGAAVFMLGGCVDAAQRAGRSAALRKPNVVLILTDDQGWGDVRSHGNALVDTPNMDSLAATGARFDRFFVSPVCAPTRASLLTGWALASRGLRRNQPVSDGNCMILQRTRMRCRMCTGRRHTRTSPGSSRSNC